MNCLQILIAELKQLGALLPADVDMPNKYKRLNSLQMFCVEKNENYLIIKTKENK